MDEQQERAACQQAFVESSWYHVGNLGSRDWSLYYAGWAARAAQVQQPKGGDATGYGHSGFDPRGKSTVGEAGHAVTQGRVCDKDAQVQRPPVEQAAMALQEPDWKAAYRMLVEAVEADGGNVYTSPDGQLSVALAHRPQEQQAAVWISPQSLTVLEKDGQLTHNTRYSINAWRNRHAEFTVPLFARPPEGQADRDAVLPSPMRFLLEELIDIDGAWVCQGLPYRTLRDAESDARLIQARGVPVRIVPLYAGAAIEVRALKGETR